MHTEFTTKQEASAVRALKKGIALVVAAVLLLAAMPAALAAENASAEAGRTVELAFRFSEVLRLDGSFSIDDPDGIVESHTISVTDTAAVSVSVGGDRVWAWPSEEPTRTTVTVTVRVTLKADAPAGKQCTVTFAGLCGSDEADIENMQQTTQSATVTVKAKKVAETDYSALKAQLAAAKDLTESDYTAASWAELAAATAAGAEVGSSKEQKRVDAAAQRIRQAIAGLVPMDRSELQAALAAVEEHAAADELCGDWLMLTDAVRVGEAVLESTDQSAVDAAAAQINEALARVDRQLTALRASEDAAAEPSAETPACVVGMHRVWPMLFAGSAAVNVLLLLAVCVQKKNKVTDDTPLVDYDIGDDIP